jgi:hypothetical protein
MNKNSGNLLLSFQLALSGLCHGQLQAKSDLIKSPAVESLLASSVKQTKVSDCTAAHGLEWHGTTVLDYSPDGLSISGSDSQGRPWKTDIPANGVMVCEVWSAKLRPNFGDDLIVLNYGNSGGGYDNELTVLFFDKEGRPVPWAAIGGFGSTKNGVSQLARLDQLGHVGIVVPLREGDWHDGYVFVSQLYSVTGDAVTKVVGRRGDAAWPVIAGNLKALVGNESNNALSAPLASPAEETTASSPAEPLRASKLFSATEGYTVSLSDGSKIPVPFIVVTDEPVKGREIFFAGDVLDGVQKAIKDDMAVRTQRQSCEEEECRPFILWGSKN